MLISKDAFKRLVSEYIDGELSADKTQQLFDCIRSNLQAKEYFLRACAMHKTMSKMYGHKVVFTKIAGIDIERLIEPPKRSKARSISEWSAVACLFIICTVLIALAMGLPQANASEEDNVNLHLQNNYQTEVLNSIKINASEASIIEIKPKHLMMKND